MTGNSDYALWYHGRNQVRYSLVTDSGTYGWELPEDESRVLLVSEGHIFSEGHLDGLIEYVHDLVDVGAPFDRAAVRDQLAQLKPPIRHYIERSA